MPKYQVFGRPGGGEEEKNKNKKNKPTTPGVDAHPL